ncbi:hypothetical protein HCC61_05895 [Streptomyces sp. HNM0575]|uniref:hypothetical protein n=1 Tax=Streptomyces sp. HNM0575 TaxID=2716338 RepID=UPI00145EA791|nr:hypothetical protein [Streptomyces sp. HNM0575]NLU72220.1 hypothetical protein [Streptomyces sp. HNM0575]
MTLTTPAQTAVVQALPMVKDLDENKVTPGVLGFIVFAAMGAVVWMLMKSMNRHMKKVDFEEGPTAAQTAGGTDGADGAHGGTGAGDRGEGAGTGDGGAASASASRASSSPAAPGDAKSSGPGA